MLVAPQPKTKCNLAIIFNMTSLRLLESRLNMTILGSELYIALFSSNSFMRHFVGCDNDTCAWAKEMPWGIRRCHGC